MIPLCTEIKLFFFSSVNLSCINFICSLSTRTQNQWRGKFPLPTVCSVIKVCLSLLPYVERISGLDKIFVFNYILKINSISYF